MTLNCSDCFCLYNLCSYFSIPLLKFHLDGLFLICLLLMIEVNLLHWQKEELTRSVYRGEILSLVLLLLNGDPSTVTKDKFLEGKGSIKSLACLLDAIVLPLMVGLCLIHLQLPSGPWKNAEHIGA